MLFPLTGNGALRNFPSAVFPGLTVRALDHLAREDHPMKRKGHRSEEEWEEDPVGRSYDEEEEEDPFDEDDDEEEEFEDEDDDLDDDDDYEDEEEEEDEEEDEDF